MIYPKIGIIISKKLSRKHEQNGIIQLSSKNIQQPQGKRVGDTNG